MNLDTFMQTEKQVEIMNVILKAADEGEHLSADEIRDRVRYGGNVTVNAILSSLSFLANHGFVVKQPRGDGTRKRNWVPTALAYTYFRPAPIASIRI